jgi:plasmid maintenance system antidote protein VapI
MLSRTANNTTKQPCSGRSTPPEIAVRILSLAHEGWTRKAIAKECGVSDKFVTSICHKNGFRFPRGGRSTPPEIADRILSLAREGWTRTAIAKDCGVSDKVVTSICHKNGFCFPRGGDQYGNKSQQEAPSWVYEERFQAAFRKRRALRGDNLD